MQAQTKPRIAENTRTTKETNINLCLNIDGNGKVEVKTGFGMGDHMLTLMAFWAGFDLDLNCEGDLYIDAHHTMEDVGLCLGQALDKALGDRVGIARTAFSKVPMDEAIAEACIDFSGRAMHIMQGQALLPPTIAGEENDLWREFFKAFACGAKMNLHISFLYGSNGHHLLESAFKSLGLALGNAVCINRSYLLSTKGSLDK